MSFKMAAEDWKLTFKGKEVKKKNVQFAFKLNLLLLSNTQVKKTQQPKCQEWIFFKL